MACVVVGCSSRLGVPTKNNETVSFHRNGVWRWRGSGVVQTRHGCHVAARATPYQFPKEPKLRKKWIKNLRRENWTPSEFSRVCCLHFEESCYRSGYKVKLLHSDAVPTLFKGSSHLRKKIIRRLKPSRPIYPEEFTSKRNSKEELGQLRTLVNDQQQEISRLQKVILHLKQISRMRARELRNARQKRIIILDVTSLEEQIEQRKETQEQNFQLHTQF